MGATNRGSILEALKSGRILLSDGAWGTQLQEKGIAPGECLELWNDSHPDTIRRIAADYAIAGADIIETNSFGGSRYKLEYYNLQKRAFELNEKAAALSRAGAKDSCWVAASLGPTGKMLFMGEVSEEDLYSAFTEQALAFEKGGADAACIETMLDIEEAGVAIRAIKENTALEVFCTFTFDKSANGEYHTMMGASPQSAMRAAIAAGADVVGANCGSGLEEMLEIAAILRATDSSTPLMIQSNAGLPEIAGGKTVFPATPEDMAEGAKKLAALGVNIIGGCCGTTPAHICAMRDAIDSL